MYTSTCCVAGLQSQPFEAVIPPMVATAKTTGPAHVSHGTVLLTSRPVASSEATSTGKVVSFAAEPSQEQQQSAMPSIPSTSGDASNENIQDQAGQHGPPPQPGRKFKRDRSSRKNSFSLPPVPPKKQASGAVDFSPASSLDFALQGAASAPIPFPQISSAQGFPATLAAASMRHSASCQDMVTDNSGELPTAAVLQAPSGGKSSRSSSADVIFCADGIDFNSRAWKMMSRKEKNRASAAASRARREAYTESLEDKVRSLIDKLCNIPHCQCKPVAPFTILWAVRNVGKLAFSTTASISWMNFAFKHVAPLVFIAIHRSCSMLRLQDVHDICTTSAGAKASSRA